MPLLVPSGSTIEMYGSAPTGFSKLPLARPPSTRRDRDSQPARLDEWEPHVKHYASSQLEAAGRAKLAKGAAAVWARSARRSCSH
jgi:hypothetical protein